MQSRYQSPQTLPFSNYSNIYAPKVCTDRTQFFDNLNKSISVIPQERLIILAGYFNFTLNHNVDWNHSQPHPHSAEALRTVVQNHSLVDMWRETLSTDRQ